MVKNNSIEVRYVVITVKGVELRLTLDEMNDLAREIAKLKPSISYYPYITYTPPVYYTFTGGGTSIENTNSNTPN